MGEIDNEKKSANKPAELLIESQSSEGLINTPQNVPNAQQTT